MSAPTARHEHGTAVRYNHGPAGDGVDPCRCPLCLAAHNEVQRRRDKLRAYGRATTTDAAPIRAHVLAQHAAGLPLRRIAMLAGVNENTVRGLVGVKPQCGPAKTVRATTATALLAVVATEEVLAAGSLVAAHGTRRRIRALVAGGRPLSVLAVELGFTYRQAHAIAHGRQRWVQAGTARHVRERTEQLWNVASPAATVQDRRLITRALTMASTHSWVPLAAWDDDDIDRPTARPRVRAATIAAELDRRSAAS